MERRAFLTAAGVAAAAPSLPPARAAAGGLVDTNVYLSSWPVRHSQPDTPARVVEKLRQHGVASAWAGSFEGALHTDIAPTSRRTHRLWTHGRRGWALGVRAIRPRAELFADLGGGDPVYGQVEMAVRELGAKRVLYGSDVNGRSFGSQIGKVLGADISIADKKRILRENLRDLLQPALRRKGIKA